MTVNDEVELMAYDLDRKMVAYSAVEMVLQRGVVLGNSSADMSVFY